jgi:hypothetical protein
MALRLEIFLKNLGAYRIAGFLAHGDVRRRGERGCNYSEETNCR